MKLCPERVLGGISPVHACFRHSMMVCSQQWYRISGQMLPVAEQTNALFRTPSVQVPMESVPLLYEMLLFLFFGNADPDPMYFIGC